MTLSINTPAKYNFFLHVTSSREDGFHDISTLFLPLPFLTDQLTFSPDDSQSLTLTFDGPYKMTASPDNLCLKAAQAFKNNTGITPAGQLKLTKNIPVCAGLGGGSSDAAATLILLKQAYNANISEEFLETIAASLGSDVPYFLNPVPTFATGRGEIMTRLPNINYSLDILLVASPFPLPVAWSYSHCTPRPDSATALQDAINAICANPLQASLMHVSENDLENAVLLKYPILKLIIDDALATGALSARISGSGPTVAIILPPEKVKATVIVNSLKETYPQCKFFCGHIQNPRS